MRDYYSFKTKEILGKRNVKKGDVILTSEPFVYIIDSQFRGQYCDHCLVSSRNKSLKPCKRCYFVFYCSETCEQAGSEVHQHECTHLKRLDPYIPPNFARLLARLIFRLKDGGDKFVEYYGEKKPRRFKDLMNHYRDIRDDENRMSDVESLYDVLRNFIGEQNLPYETDFLGLYGRVLVNRFCLMDSHMCPIGSVVYLAGSIFDHSCIPNAYATFIGTKLEVRSLVDMPQLDYNKVFISYIDMMKTTSQRREELQTNWYFWCECSLCLNTDRHMFESCIKCGTPNCGAPIPVPEKLETKLQSSSEPPLACLVCNCPVEEDFLKEYQSAVAFTKEALKGLKEESPALDICLTMLERQGSLFSHINVWRVRALDFSFNSAYVNGIYGLAIDYGRQNVEGMRFFYGSEHPTFGLFLMKLGKSLLYLKIYREGLSIIEEAERVLTISLGEKHALVADEIYRLKMIANEDVDIYMERRIIDKEKAEHEMVCKHCGRRKNLINKINKDNSNLSSPINGMSRKVDKNDVYASIEALKRLTETLSKNEVSNHVNSETNGDIFASLANGPNGKIFSKVFSQISKKKNGIYLETKQEPVDNNDLKEKKEEKIHTSKLKSNDHSHLKIVDKFPTIYERNEKSNKSKPETNGDILLIKPSNQNHNQNLLKTDDSSTTGKDGHLTKCKGSGNGDLHVIDKGVTNGTVKSEVDHRNTNSLLKSEMIEDVTKPINLPRNNFPNDQNLKDVEKVVIPSSLTRLLRYGDKLGIRTKSKVNRDTFYCNLVSPNIKLASSECVQNSVPLAKPEKTQKEDTSKKEISLSLKPEDSKPVEKIKEQESKLEVTYEKLQASKNFRKEKPEEKLTKNHDHPREKITRLYTQEVEQNWGLDYVPEKHKITPANKYKMAETNKIWDKFLSDADVRWARYIAEIEFNKLLAQETSESDGDGD